MHTAARFGAVVACVSSVIFGCSDDHASGDAGGGSTGSASDGTGTGAGSTTSGAGGASSSSVTGSGGGTGSTSGGEGGGLVDTCPIPAGPFATSVVPNAGSNAEYRRVQVQVPTGVPASLFTVFKYANGSFSGTSLRQLTQDGADWSSTTIADEQWDISIARGLATTHGDDPCVVYSDDYEDQVRLSCASISDRVIAPGATDGLAIAAAGALKHVARIRDWYALEWIATDGGTPPEPELVDEAEEIASISIAVDAQGVPHVAYAALLDGPQDTDVVEIRYAMRSGGVWTIETVASHGLASAEDEYVAVSLALDHDGDAVIAFHDQAARSLVLVEQTGGAFGAPVTLLAPQPGYPTDDVGEYVQLEIDCYDRRRVVYSRELTTDPKPNSRLYHGVIEAGALAGSQMLPLVGTFVGFDYDLDYHVDAEGHDHIGVMSYYAVRYVSR